MPHSFFGVQAAAFPLRAEHFSHMAAWPMTLKFRPAAWLSLTHAIRARGRTKPNFQATKV